jgi:hypothetical protein
MFLEYEVTISPTMNPRFFYCYNCANLSILLEGGFAKAPEKATADLSVSLSLAFSNEALSPALFSPKCYSELDIKLVIASSPSLTESPDGRPFASFIY